MAAAAKKSEVLTRVVARPTSASSPALISAAAIHNETVQRLGATQKPGRGGGGFGTTDAAPLRRTVPQVRSEPAFTLTRLELQEEAEAKAKRREYREGLSDLLSFLDDQCAQRREDHKRELYAAKAKELASVAYKRQLETLRQPEKPPWTYAPGELGYFEAPQYEKGGSLTSVKNPLLQGIYGVNGWKPPHSDSDGDTAWKPFTTNENGEAAGVFGSKARHRMTPGEKACAERLEHVLKESKALEREDALKKTDGVLKRRCLEENAGKFSALKREQKAWTTQAVMTHVYFSQPEHSKPGDDEHDTALMEYITQPARTKDPSRDIVIGDNSRTSHWKPRSSGGAVGSARRLAKAEALLCPPGVRRQREAEAARVAASAASPGGLARGAVRT